VDARRTETVEEKSSGFSRWRLLRSALIWLSLLVVTYSLLISAPNYELFFGDESLRFCKRIAGPDTVCTFTEESWKNTIHMRADDFVTDIYVKDIIPAEFSVEVTSFSHGEVEVTSLGQGHGATMIEWWIDELQANEQAMMMFVVTTRRNPAGNQEFTTYGTYTINPGYDISWTYRGETYESGTPERTVVAIDCGRLLW
jgi:hypothetical protein